MIDHERTASGEGSRVAPAMTGCVVCETRSPDAVGVLCPACAASLVIGDRRAPGIVSTRGVTSPAAWLIDGWGQIHAVSAPCRIGRDRERCELSIADLSVSAEHAELRREREGWRVRDRGSSNGTSVGARANARDAALAHRERVRFGSIGFVFWADADPPAHHVPAPEVRTLIPAGAGFRIEGPGGAVAVIRASRGHPLARAPGELEYRSTSSDRARRIALPRLQFQLLRTLCDAAIAADGEARAGYVGSHELVATLPFQSGSPSPNHVRQVVATLRASLGRAGLTGGGSSEGDAVIQAAEGLGYRVAWTVVPLEPESR
jgi:hypothetical protein